MSIGANKLDRSELRRQRRYLIPVFEVIVDCELFHSLDWSAGGVHLDGLCEGAIEGTPVEGWIALPDSPESFAFSGEVLRTDPTTGTTVLRFDDIEDEAIAFLDQSIARRLH